MSRIYFHSPDVKDDGDDVEVRGAERAHLGWLTGSCLITSVGPLLDYGDRPHWIRKLLGPKHYLNLDPSERVLQPRFEQAMEVVLRVGNDDFFFSDGSSMQIYTVGLNTAIAMGGDPLKMAARLHGQCEIHSYVEGKNRGWLADIILRGRSTGVLRADMGWEGVVQLLKKSNQHPIVTSYSVCEGFPNYRLISDSKDWTPQQKDEYNEAPRSEKWDRSMAALRTQSTEHGMTQEMFPEDWDDFYFRKPINGFNLYEQVKADVEKQG